MILQELTGRALGGSRVEIGKVTDGGRAEEKGNDVK